MRRRRGRQVQRDAEFGQEQRIIGAFRPAGGAVPFCQKIFEPYGLTLAADGKSERGRALARRNDCCIGCVMHLRVFTVLCLIAAPVLAAKKPLPPPPLPPLVLDAATPVVTVTIDGQPLRLRVDPATTQAVQINGSAAARLGLADRARLVNGRPADFGRSSTQVGKVKVNAVTSDAVLAYAGRALTRELAWATDDPVAGADGAINPRDLPHDEVRLVRRAVRATDTVTRLPMRWDNGRGLLGAARIGAAEIDVVIAPAAAQTLATAAAASILAAGHGGTLTGPARDAVISHGVKRPVRDVVFARAVDIAGVRLPRVAARVFDWSGKTDIPDADLAAGEAVVGGRTGAQRQWAKLAIGADRLDACAEIVWRRVPEAIELVCPGLR